MRRNKAISNWTRPSITNGSVKKFNGQTEKKNIRTNERANGWESEKRRVRLSQGILETWKAMMMIIHTQPTIRFDSLPSLHTAAVPMCAWRKFYKYKNVEMPWMWYICCSAVVWNACTAYCIASVNRERERDQLIEKAIRFFCVLRMWFKTVNVLEQISGKR